MRILPTKLKALLTTRKVVSSPNSEGITRAEGAVEPNSCGIH